MNITCFADFLTAATQQPQPQRLLFVFAAAELPDNPSKGQQMRFEAGQGGALAPVMCVDRLPAELPGFEALLAESQQMGKHWDIVFASGIAGKGGQAPSSQDADQPLNQMVEMIRQGHIERFLTFTRQGELVQLR